MVGLAVERFEHTRGDAGFFRRASEREVFAAARDGDFAGVFDLPQVFIQRAAQIGQPLVIDRGKGYF